MSGNLKGITLEIAGDTSGLDKALSGTESSIKSISKELKSVEAALKLDPGNMEMLGQKSELTAKKIEETKNKLETLKEAQRQNEEAFKNGTLGEDKYRGLQREISFAEIELKKLSETAKDTSFSIDNGGKSAKELASDFEQAGSKTSVFGEVLKANLLSNAITSGLNILSDSIRKITHSFADFVSSGMSATLEFRESQSKLTQVMRNTMDASDEEVQSIIRLAEAQERLGVISKNSQIAGAQELGTYLERKETLEAIIPVMNDMLAQQYGVNASQESAVTIATMLGKVMNGQVGALSRYGYSFDEAQEKVLKYGTEAQRAAVLVDVVSQSVGGMNEALKQTDDGKILGLNARIGETQGAIGELALGIKNQIMMGILPIIENLAREVLKFLQENEESIKRFVDDFIIAVQKIFDKSKEIIGVVMDKVKWFIDFIIDHKDIIIALAIGIGTVTAAIEAMSIAQAALNLVMSLNPISMVVLAIGGLVAALVYLYNTNETARDIIQNVWHVIENIITNAIKTISGVFEIFCGVFTGDWDRMWKGVKTSFEGSTGSLVSYFTGVVNGILSQANFLIDGINRIFKTKLEPIKLFVDPTDLKRATEEQREAYNDLQKHVNSGGGGSSPGGGMSRKELNETKKDLKDTQAEFEAAVAAAEEYEKSLKKAKKTASEKTNEALKKELDTLEHKKKIGELTTEQEIQGLEKILKNIKMSAKERESVEEKLYSAKQALSNETLKKELDALEHKKKTGELTNAEEIKGLEDILKNVKMSSKERESVEEKLFSAKQELIKKEKKEQEELEKERVKNINEYGDVIAEALKRQKREEIDIRKEAVQEQIDLVSDVKYREIDTSKEITSTKLKLIDEEYIAKVKCVDEGLAAALSAGNKEIQKRIDIIALTDKETAAKLQAAQDEIDNINKVAEAERQQAEEKSNNDKRRKLEEKIATAETVEEKERLLQELYDFEDSVALKGREKERKARLAELEQQKKDLLANAKEVINTNAKEAESILKEQNKPIKNAAEELKNGKFSPEDEKQSLKSLEAAYKNFETTATKAAAELINSGKEGQEKALKILDTYYPDWKEKGMKFTDYLVQGMDDGEKNIVAKAAQLGEKALEAFEAAFSGEGGPSSFQSATSQTAGSASSMASFSASPMSAFMSNDMDNDILAFSDSAISPVMAQARSFSNIISNGLSSVLSDNMGLINSVAQKVGLSITSSPAPTQVIENSPTINFNTTISNVKDTDVPYLVDRENRRALRKLTPILKS